MKPISGLQANIECDLALIGNSILQKNIFFSTERKEQHQNLKRTEIIKQFVVTNCSKEQPGSIVNETLKNAILMLRDTSKESNFHADSKYISLIKFNLTNQKL